ncbi:MAG: TadE/TadG family type IV pilus assembly protein [Candidatus Korobacteraceae bacterium]
MRRTKCRRQQGSVLVELVLVLPLMLSFLLFVSEGAAMVHAHQVINNAAREGARASAVPENKCIGETASGCLASIQQVAIAYAQENGVSLNIANVAVDQSVQILNGAVAIRASRVSITYPYQLRYLPNIAGMASALNLVGSAEFRNLY